MKSLFKSLTGLAILFAATGHSTAQDGAYRVTAEHAVGRPIVEVRPVASGGFVYGAAANGESEIGRLDETGAVRWSRAVPGTVLGVRPEGSDRLLASILRADSKLEAEVVDATDGSVVRRFRVNNDMDYRLSAAGDAVVFYANALESASGILTIRRVSNGDSRTLNLDRPIHAAVPLDYDRLVVLLDNGRVDFFNSGERAWSAGGERFQPGGNFQVSAEAMLALVSMPLGAFKVLDLNGGHEVYRYDPAEPVQALRSLGALDDVRAGVRGATEPTERVSRVAMNLRPTLEPNGTVSLRAVAELSGFEVRVSPRNGTARREHRLRGVEQVMSSRGQADALARAEGRKGGPPRLAFGSGGAAAVAVNDRVVVLSRR